MKAGRVFFRSTQFLGVVALLAFAGVVPSVSCVQGGPDDGSETAEQGNQGTGAQFDKKDAKFSMDVWIGTQGLQILEVRPYDDMQDGAKSVAPSTKDSLRWEIRDDDGNVQAVGYVPDSRVVVVDPADGKHGVRELEGTGMVQLDVPTDKGTLYLFESNSTMAQPASSFRSTGCTPGGGGLGGAKIPKAGSGAESSQLSGLKKIVDHGACDGNLSILIVAEAFTSGQLGTFESKARSIVDGMKRFSIYKNNWDRINVWTLSKASQQSGISDDKAKTHRNTLFGVSYGSEANKGRPPHRCVLPRHMTSTGASIISKAKKIAHAQVVVYLANDSGFGGCRQGTNIAMTMYNGDTNSLSRTISHEIGHGVFNFADEYVDAPLCRNQAGELNTTKHPSNPPWKKWGLSGAIQGAQYCATGIYRAQSTCMMNDSHHASDFCSVCKAIAKDWFKHRVVCTSCYGEPSMCTGGTMCSYNGPRYGYCCRKPQTGSQSCTTHEECPSGQVCAEGGSADHVKFYCMPVDSSLKCPKKAHYE